MTTAEFETLYALRWKKLLQGERRKHKQVLGLRVGANTKDGGPRVRGARKGARDAERVDRMREMAACGARTVDISRAIGISESSVRYYRKHYDF